MSLQQPAITSLFDSITYSKGASILRMLERIVGSEQFRTSLQDYLTSNRFDVGDPQYILQRIISQFINQWRRVYEKLVGRTELSIIKSRFIR